MKRSGGDFRKPVCKQLREMPEPRRNQRAADKDKYQINEQRAQRSHDAMIFFLSPEAIAFRLNTCGRKSFIRAGEFFVLKNMWMANAAQAVVAEAPTQQRF